MKKYLTPEEGHKLFLDIRVKTKDRDEADLVISRLREFDYPGTDDSSFITWTPWDVQTGLANAYSFNVKTNRIIPTPKKDMEASEILGYHKYPESKYRVGQEVVVVLKDRGVIEDLRWVGEEETYKYLVLGEWRGAFDLCLPPKFKPGDHVQHMSGFMNGVIVSQFLDPKMHYGHLFVWTIKTSEGQIYYFPDNVLREYEEIREKPDKEN